MLMRYYFNVFSQLVISDTSWLMGLFTFLVGILVDRECCVDMVFVVLSLSSRLRCRNLCSSSHALLNSPVLKFSRTS